MTDTLRDKLIKKGWVTPFNADTLVRLIDEHYAELTKPVPVSERLPGPEDCDAEGRCWWWSAETVERVSCWMLSRGTGAEMCWLPAQALPLPEVGQ